MCSFEIFVKFRGQSFCRAFESRYLFFDFSDAYEKIHNNGGLFRPMFQANVLFLYPLKIRNLLTFKEVIEMEYCSDMG